MSPTKSSGDKPTYAPFTTQAIEAIRSIPRGRVATYATVATLAGSARAARQVVRVLHSLARVEELPWHRVINSRGLIALPRGAGFEEQKELLEAEGVKVRADGAVSLRVYGWTSLSVETPRKPRKNVNTRE